MNIGFCLESTFNSGGMERMLTVIANALCVDYHITVITAFNNGRPDFFGFEEGVRRVDLGIVRDDFAPKRLRQEYKARLEQYLVDNPQDVTISLGSLEYFFLSVLKDGSKKVLWFHFALNYDMMTCHVSRFRAVNRLVGTLKTYRRLLVASKYDHVICLSKEDLKRWRRHMSNVSQIYNPNTITKSNEPDYTAKRVIAVGRLDPQKGFDVLISAWKRVAELYPDWTLDIYGEGDSRQSLQRQIDELSLGDRVFLRGRSNDMSEEFARHSIMVLSSRYEGFGLVLCEASVCAVPQVSFSCESGPSEIISDRESGILVSPVGDEKKMADALTELMASESLRRKMGLCAERLSHRFALPTIVGQWRSMLGDIAAGGIKKRWAKRGFLGRLFVNCRGIILKLFCG